MKDYAKTITQSKEAHGQQQSRQTLAKSVTQKSQSAEREKAKPDSGPGFFSVIAIFIVIAVLFAVYRQYFKHRQESNLLPHQASQTVPAQATNPQFDFYTVLPNGSTPGAQRNNAGDATSTPVNIPPVSSAPASSVPVNSTANPLAPVAVTASSVPGPVSPDKDSDATTSQYYLNAGSFANSADAQQMLSQLLLLGVQANIQTMQDNSAPSYQILVGPFADQDTLNIVKNQLAAHQIQAVVVLSGKNH